MSDATRAAALSLSQSDEIYVGYLPVPPGQRRFLWRLVPVILWTLCGATILWALSQPRPGRGVWVDGHIRVFRGTVLAKPYPVLFADDAGDGVPGALLLVEVGKHGGGRAVPLDGKRVAISGWMLLRDGRRMIEMEPGDGALRVEGEGAGPVVTTPGGPDAGRPVTLRGEIVDSKCFLGAMKPGDGKTHKACATLCITGGIPPMLVVPREGGEASDYYLLADPGGGPLDVAAYDRIGEPVEVRGRLVQWGPEGGPRLPIIKLRPEDISRL